VVTAVIVPALVRAEEVQAATAAGLIRYAWLIALLPLLSAAVILFFGKRTPGGGWIWGVATVGTGLVLSLGILWHFVTGGGPHAAAIDWFTIGTLRVELGQYVDGLTAVMLVVVTAVSLCVHIYSIGYMHGDARFTWFYVALSLFTAAMLNVVIADNLFQLLVGWEVMGFCSYILIGHWWEEHVNSSSAIKAFITTRIGDIPFLFGVFVLLAATGFTTANIQEIGHLVAGGEIARGVVAIAALLLFGGAVGKSAQFPLHVWLPDAMAGPTPVSALIHAATMVAAGVYMVGRTYEVFVHADPAVLQLVGAIGVTTAFGAGLLGLVQDDIKRVLAYSTVSQLGYMITLMAAGPAGRNAAFFHLFTHAFFKALLFLGSGSVIHACHTNNMSEMGGLRKAMPITFWTFVIGALALAGVPPLAGFFSKDELLVVLEHEHEWGLFWLLLGAAAVTAFYTARMVLQTFFGEYRGHGHPHESPPSMTGPLVALAGATVFVGFLGFAGTGAPFFDWVYLEHPEAVKFVPWVAMLSVTAAGLGLAGGYLVYRRWREPDPITALGPLYRLLVNKYYLDEIYWRGVVRPVRDVLSAAANWSNQVVLDGIVDGAARVARWLSERVRGFDERVVDGAVNGIGQTAGFTGGLLRYVQSGNVQRYAAFLFAGVVVLTVIFTRI
jgi:NADH-quinone oxidoreductase subunit L